MNVFRAIEERRSIRNFTGEVPDEKTVLSIIESGRLAPSAGNRQPYRFVVVWDREKIRKIAEASMNFLKKAGVVIVGVAKPRESPKWYPVDTAIALEHMVLAAQALGLGTCWIGTFSEEKVKEILKIPEDATIVAMLGVGYPKLVPSPTSRKRMEDITYRDEWNKPYTRHR